MVACILVRELDERLGFSELIAQHLTDSDAGRTRNCRWPICCVSRSTADWLAMRMSTMPSGCRKIRPSG